MRILYINNPYDKNDREFLSEVKNKHTVEVLDFNKAKQKISFRATPTILLLHEGLELLEHNISALLDTPTLEELETALSKTYPYPEQPKPELSEIDVVSNYLLEVDMRLVMIELGI